MPRSVTLAGIALALAAGTPTAGAQTTADDTASTPRVGDMARLRTQPLGARGVRAACVGRVTAASDTITMSSRDAERLCPTWTYAPAQIERFDIARSSRGSRLAHAAIGAGIGVLAGGIVGGLAGRGASCAGCDLRDIATAIGAVGGAALAGTAGLIVGIAIPAGPRWQSVGTPAAVRVAR